MIDTVNNYMYDQIEHAGSGTYIYTCNKIDCWHCEMMGIIKPVIEAPVQVMIRRIRPKLNFKHPKHPPQYKTTRRIINITKNNRNN